MNIMIQKNYSPFRQIREQKIILQGGLVKICVIDLISSWSYLMSSLSRMGELCEEAIGKATTALKEGSMEQAQKVIEADEEIDQAEIDIERLCLKLLLQQQPVARDLRQISAALKMITDMERIGDQASDIAEIIITEEKSEAQDIPKIIKMSEAASKDGP